jgi:DNA segregation ATPase FtsK/SpoIIIE, S-DNA-T family
MLSWIKRLMQMFLGENEKKGNHYDSVKTGLNKQYDPVDEENESDAKKELEARVLYKYPKGQFKFPLFPDNEESQGVKSRREERSSSESSLKEENVPELKETKKQTEPAVVHKKPIGNHQVFRPTEIPSPVYAFNRPKIVDESIEYELKGQKMKQSNSEGLVDETRKEEAVLEVGQQTLFNKEQERMEKQKVIFEETVKEEEQPKKLELELEEEVLSKEEAIIEEEERSKELELELEEEVLSKITEAKYVENIQLDVNEPALHENELCDHSKESQERMKVDEPPTENDQVERFEETEDEHVADLSDVVDNNQVAATAETAVEPPKKKHVPFNVLMLKQDKRKLEKQHSKESDLESIRQTKKQNPVNFNPKDINEEPETKDIQGNEGTYQFPPLDLLEPPVIFETSKEWLYKQEEILNETLRNFNVGARVVNVTQGPSVTRFEVQPEPGVKVNKITNLADDIKLSLAARDIRMEAPIPGKHTIGIEVPNASSRPVLISEIIRTSGFSETPSPLPVALGLDISGAPIVTDLKKMPHGLIAGATGSGKSVCINTMLVSLLYKAHPDDVKLLLIDPKMVELAPYNHIPHLVSPVITDVKAATASLKWAVEEMERRYELFAHTGVRDIARYNELAMEHKRYAEKLPYIVIVIDELADLMMMSPTDVEEAICRIAQKARACGIHLIIATQRPSVDVITGLIKANVPTRIAFSVSSQVDSRTIIDISGAEKLLGRGDMLFLENGSSKPYRLQGTFVSDREIDDIVAFVREQRTPEYLFEQDELIKKSQMTEEEDELFYDACSYVIEQGGASTSSIQRRFKVGYNRAARLIDMMEQNGFISEGRGSKPRDVLISADDLESFQENSTLH